MTKRILRLPAVEEKIGYKHAHIYNMMKRGEFPRPIQLSPNGHSVGWLESEIDEWIDRRIEASRSGGEA